MAKIRRRQQSKQRSKLQFFVSVIAVVVLGLFISSMIEIMDNTNTTATTFELSTSSAAAAVKNAASSLQTATKTTAPGNKQHHCINDDFQPKHNVGIWTMLNDNMAYVRGALKMGMGVKAHTQTPHDLVVMELQSKPLNEEEWKLLHDVGFMRCQVTSIPPPPGVKTRADLKEKFAVLHVWAMEVYDTVLFVDADAFVQNSVDDLINMDLQGKPLGVTKDIRDKKWVSTFNSGVMVLHPSVAEHTRLVELLNSGITFDYIMSDQGFLNEVYKDNWHEIGFVNNANLALYRFQRDYWDQFKLEDINVIHYTMQKPWRCRSNGEYGPICDVWIKAFPEIDNK
jgi:hypothetical protein